MKQLPPFDEDHYNSQIEALFGRLERVKPLGRRTYVGDKKALFRRVKRVSMTLGAVSALSSLVSVFAFPRTVGNSTVLTQTSVCLGLLVLGGAFIWLGLEASARSSRLLNSIMSLKGYASSLSVEKAKEVAEWSKRHPRLLPLLARWQVANPDKQLNDADFRVLEKSMCRIGSIESARDRHAMLQAKEQARRFQVEGVLSEAGIISAANKLQLEALVALQPKDDQSQSEQKRSM